MEEPPESSRLDWNYPFRVFYYWVLNSIDEVRVIGLKQGTEHYEAIKAR